MSDGSRLCSRRRHQVSWRREYCATVCIRSGLRASERVRFLTNNSLLRFSANGSLGSLCDLFTTHYGGSHTSRDGWPLFYPVIRLYNVYVLNKK